MFDQLIRISDTVGNLTGKHETLLCGPMGIRKLETYWKNGFLAALIIKGGR